MKWAAMSLIVLSVLLGLSLNADGQIAPTIQYEWDSVSNDVNVDPRVTDDPVVTFNGTLTVETNSQADITIYLRIDSSGFESTIDPVECNCPLPYTTYVFNLTAVVHVPPATTFGSRSIIIEGDWSSSGGILVGTIPSVHLIYQVRPYYWMQLTGTRDPYEVEKGSRTELPFTIKNNGNAEDRIATELINGKELSAEGFDITIPQTKSIQSGEVIESNLSVLADTDTGQRKFEVLVRSEYSEILGTNESANITLRLEVVKKSSRYALDDVGLPGFEAPIVFTATIAIAVIHGRRRATKHF